MSKSPGTISTSQTVLQPQAQLGNFQYTGSDGVTRTVNALNAAHNFNSALPGTINSTIASELTSVNSSLKSGFLSGLPDPNLATLNWLQSSPTTFYYPTFRIDYNATEKLRFHLAFNETKRSSPPLRRRTSRDPPIRIKSPATRTITIRPRSESTGRYLPRW